MIEKRDSFFRLYYRTLQKSCCVLHCKFQTPTYCILVVRLHALVTIYEANRTKQKGGKGKERYAGLVAQHNTASDS